MITSIQNYTHLIQSLPLTEQAFTSKAINWQKSLSDYHFEQIFKGEESICLSRQDVQNTKNLELFILKTILCGYPKGMRGKNFINIYRNIGDLGEILNVSDRNFLKADDLLFLQKELNKIIGLGHSTYSKFLYFRDFKFEGIPALILNERLIRVFNNKVFKDFENLDGISQYKASRMYLNYL